MKIADKDVLYSEIGPDNAATLHVEPGEEFLVRTQMNAGPWLDNHPDGAALRKKWHGGNPSSGCIYVDGARPGDVLAVHVGQIALDPLGYTLFGGATGAMPGWLGASDIGRHYREVEIRDNRILWSDDLESLLLWLEESYGYDRGEAFLLLGQVLEARVTQFVNPTFSYIAKVARAWLRTPDTNLT